MGKMEEENQYLCKRIIGSGSYGKVYLYEHPSTKDRYAVKQYVEESNKREYGIIKQLNHPNIVKMLDYDVVVRDDKRVGRLSLEYLPMNLKQYIRNKYMSDRCIKNILYQLLLGTEYMHSNNICHRDLKPDNVLLDEKAKIAKICDFSLSKKMSKSATHIHGVGTNSYRAPELVFKSTKYNYAIDMWAIGCIIIGMITKRTIFYYKDERFKVKAWLSYFGAPTAADLESMGIKTTGYVIEGEKDKDLFEELTCLSAECKDMLKRIFVYDIEKRITAKECLSHALFKPEGKIYDQIYQKNICMTVVRVGKNKGQVCGNRLKGNDAFCKRHNKVKS